jgi:hypothetical protein
LIRVFREKIESINLLDKNRIDQFILDNNGLIFHQVKFNELVSKAFKTDFSYLLAFQDKLLIGICPLHTIKNGIIRNTYSNPSIFVIPYGGWIFDASATCLEILLNKMITYANESLTYWSTIDLECIRPSKKTNYTVHQTAIIDLSLSVDELFENISKNTRHNVRRAKNKGISVEKIGIDQFCELSGRLKKKIGLKDISDSFYKLLAKIFEDSGMFILGAKYMNSFISAIITIGNKNFMHAWVAGRIEELPPNLYQNELLWWESIKMSRDSGSKFFDLCVIEPERLPQIAIFKSGFSKNFVPYYNFTAKGSGYRYLNKLQKCFSIK